MNKKLRLVVTAQCHNRCPMCCNNRLDLAALPVVDRWNYDEIMITGGEPTLFPGQVEDIIRSIKVLHKMSGLNGKVYIYTALANRIAAMEFLSEADGLVVTPHYRGDALKFTVLNELLLRRKHEEDRNLSSGLVTGKSLRLNLFPEVKEFLPPDIDLSLWKVKNMEWIKDCPVPDGEDLRRIDKLLVAKYGWY